jgi:hypothetical protein
MWMLHGGNSVSAMAKSVWLTYLECMGERTRRIMAMTHEQAIEEMNLAELEREAQRLRAAALRDMGATVRAYFAHKLTAKGKSAAKPA